MILLLEGPLIIQLLLIFATKVTFWLEIKLELVMVTEHGLECFQSANVSSKFYPPIKFIVHVCLAISCPNVSVPRNGSVNSTDTILGTVLHFTCDNGYSLVGTSSIQCQKDGQWSGVFPLCLLINIDCGDPGTPLHSVKFYSNTTLGSVISFSCLSGYMLVGVTSIQCNSDGKWSDALPRCLPTDCGDPGEPLFGRRELSNTTYRSTVNYTCVNSTYYLLEGSATRQCLANGSWSGSLPSCVLIDCGYPESSAFNGTVDFFNTTVGSLATYHCEVGYKLVGEAQHICLTNGTWSGTVPTCVAITHCNVPDIPVFGVRLNGNYSVGSVVMYQCIGGYILIGSSVRTCLVNGTWSETVPICRPIDCGDPGTPANSVRDLTGTRLLSTVRYSCNDGYSLVGGSSIRECLSNGSWSGVTPECELVDCGSPAIPTPAGVLSISNTTAGSSAIYTCLEGYNLVGEAERVCLNNGTWSGSVPSCIEITDCGFPDVPLLGLIQLEDIVIGSLATYSCDEDYMLLGNQNRTCLPTGEWSGETPVCVSI